MRNRIRTALVAAATALAACGRPTAEEPVDARTPIVLPPESRVAVLAEMRTMLASVQGVLDAAVRGDAQGIVKAAAVSGMAGAADPTLERILPREFLALGMRTHEAFDALAEAAAAGEGPDTAVAHVARLMANCVACHEAFRLEVR